MAKLYNLAKVLTSTTGTGTITLGAADSGYLTFAQAGVQSGDVVSYGIQEGSNTEVGRGTYTSSGTTLSRDTVLKSTNSNSQIVLGGSAFVYITALAEDFTAKQDALTFPLASTLGGTGINNAGTLTIPTDVGITGGGTLALGGFTVTAPASLTLAGLGIANVFTTLNTFTSLKLSTGLIYPSANSTTAIQINKADGITNVLNVDTTNVRVGIGTVAPTYVLHIYNTASTNLAAFQIENTSTTNSTVPLRMVTSYSNSSVPFFGTFLGIRHVSTVGEGAGAHFALYNSNNVETEYGGIAAVIRSSTSTLEAGDLVFVTTNTSTRNERMRITAAGNVGIGTNDATSKFQVNGQSNIQQLLVTGHTTQAVGTPLVQFTRNDAAAGVSAMLGLTALGSGAAGDGGSLQMLGKSSTTAAQSMGLIDYRWITATHASRAAAIRLYAYDTASRLGLEIEASGSVPKISFYGGTTVVRGAALTTQLTTITHIAPGTPDYAIQDFTQFSPWGFADHDEANTFLSVVKNLQTRVAELEARLGSATGVNLFS